MARLLLVRHGQARAADLDHYDNLSPLGAQQARHLANWFADRRLSVERVVVGPRRRHAETWQAMSEVFADRSVQLPDPEPGPDFDEHDGIDVFRAGLPAMRERPDSAAIAIRAGSGRPRDVFAAFRHAMALWAAGELPSPGRETWSVFRARAARVLAANTADRCGNTLAITSGGLLTAVVGELLGLSDTRLLDLMWSPYNASWTEVAFTEDYTALERFNVTAHLPPPLLTKV